MKPQGYAVVAMYGAGGVSIVNPYPWPAHMADTRSEAIGEFIEVIRSDYVCSERRLGTIKRILTEHGAIRINQCVYILIGCANIRCGLKKDLEPMWLKDGVVRSRRR